jgi:hypothetical protein
MLLGPIGRSAQSEANSQFWVTFVSIWTGLEAVAAFCKLILSQWWLQGLEFCENSCEGMSVCIF